MPHYNYGAKNGMSTLVKLIRLLCRIYLSFSGAITTYITDNVPDSGDRTVILNWLNQAQTVCNLIEATVGVTYES